MQYCIPFSDLTNVDVPRVGGKNASLGEMVHDLTPLGIRIPNGFAVTADAYRSFLHANALEQGLASALDTLDTTGLTNLHEVGTACRDLIAHASLPAAIAQEITDAYHVLAQHGHDSVAIRSSATAEDLPTASFAGQHDSFLDVSGDIDVLKAVQRCYVSLFNDRAIKYRLDNGFPHMSVALSVGIQHMVRSDVGSAGVAFTLDPETGFSNVVYLTSTWGQGESIVQGTVTPDEFYLFKPSIAAGRKSVIHRRIGAKETSPPDKQDVMSISLDDAETLGQWCLHIERHYGRPMDIEFAKDGITGELFIVQARPETVHSQQQHLVEREYHLRTKAPSICTGKAVGRSIASGAVRIVTSLSDAPRIQQGDVIVADSTNPDWNALLRKASCIVTNKGGRTSHASIVARELGIHAVVGTGNATSVLKDGQMVTVSCEGGDAGRVYDGKMDWDVTEVEISNNEPTHVQPMFILADPDKAMRLAAYPNMGVGLMRMEFVITNVIRIHPMALVHYDELPDSNDKKAIQAMTRLYSDKRAFFVDKLSEAIALVAAAFHPKDVIVRMSDFKTNEYAMLIGGAMYEPEEENPMLGFRGASRYYNERYREGFGLECEAIRVVRDDMGLTNVKVMIPFCRTVEEGKRVLDVMHDYKLVRGVNGLEVYVMAEIPSNVILAEQFAEIFDGFSIGSNDLTQLTLGIDRDSSIIHDLFDESNAAVTTMLADVIRKAKKAGRKIGLCGQAPSDHPEFARFLVEQGIDSISFTPDALLRGIDNIRAAEQAMR
ncbi:MAG: phosphoenolpyruvate synthase [Ignavibacteriae bacterium]|nr:MAG: phosphoenolpyruvate synthase [Ignavibacteriota bacterium]